MPGASSDPIQTRELSTGKLKVGTGQTPITTQTTVSDPAATASAIGAIGNGADGASSTANFNKIQTAIDQLVTDTAANNTAIDLIIVRLKAFGLIA